MHIVQKRHILHNTGKKMLKNTVLRQKQEKDRLLSFPYIERAKAQAAQQWVGSDLIKVVVGPRRAGKSVFSLMLLKDTPYAYFNFDDESINVDTLNLDNLLQELHGVYGQTKFILFDEIQNLPRWELFVNRLQRQGYNLTLTGSNAKLLSAELATALTGRHIPIEIMPFDFKEFLRAKQYNEQQPENLLELVHEYLVSGGYPEVVIKNLDPHVYLSVLFDSLIFKDVVKRHKVRFAQQIDMLGLYLINNISAQYSMRKLANVLNFKSGVTLEKYLGYLVEAYLFFSLNRYSTKTLERLTSPRKAYAVDNGFVTAKAVQHSPDTGKLMENLVFCELIKRGYQPNRDLFYYKTRNDREIDFVLKETTNVRELVQVVYDASNADTQAREIKALVEAGDELHADTLTLVTWDMHHEIKRNDTTINVVPLWQWLMK